MPHANEPDQSLTFTLPELARLTGIDHRTLLNWQKRGLIQPTRRSSTGSGTPSLFDERDALAAFILAELRTSGIEMRLLERIAPDIGRLARTAEGREVLLVSDGEASLSRPEDLPTVVTSARPSLVLRLSSAFESLRAMATPRAA